MTEFVHNTLYEWHRKSRILVIGKHQKPRWYKNVNSLPVQYEFNKKT
jgi:hypothetical protein